MAERTADLQESRELYRSLFELTPDAIVTFGPCLDLLMVNQEGVALFGYDEKEEMIGLKARQLIAPEGINLFEEEIMKCLAGGNHMTAGGIGIRKDGGTFPMEWRAELVPDVE